MKLKDRKEVIIICACEKADNNCYLTCAKGRRIEPKRVYCIPSWPQCL